MAFFKAFPLLGAITSVGADDLVYVADTNLMEGSTYASKKVTKANFFSGYITTETYVGTQISNLINWCC